MDKSVAEVLAHLGAGEILMDGGNTREAGTAPDQKDFCVAAQAACQAVFACYVATRLRKRSVGMLDWSSFPLGGFAASKHRCSPTVRQQDR